jgi:hypothetical protein
MYTKYFLTSFFIASLTSMLIANDYLSSNRFVIDNDAFYYSNGNLGMGTTSPLGRLDIAKNNSTQYLLTFLQAHTNVATGFGFYSGALTTLQDGVMSLRRINTSGNEASNINMFILASSNVGIGSLAEPPDHAVLPDKGKLHVSGNVYVGPSIYAADHKLNGLIQKVNGAGAAYLAPTKEEISFGYDYATNYFKVLINGQAIQFNDNGGAAKTFVISHPNNPSLHLVHAMQELPESTVQYIGSAQLKNGQATVTLPGYFEDLTRQEGRHIRLSTVDGFDTLQIKKVSDKKIHKGKFIVMSNNPKSTQAFDWEVTAVRNDVSILNPTPLKSQTSIKGRPPYTYIETSL